VCHHYLAEGCFAVLKQDFLLGYMLLHWVDDEVIFIQAGTSFRSAPGLETSKR